MGAGDRPVRVLAAAAAGPGAADDPAVVLGGGDAGVGAGGVEPGVTGATPGRPLDSSFGSFLRPSPKRSRSDCRGCVADGGPHTGTEPGVLAELPGADWPVVGAPVGVGPVGGGPDVGRGAKGLFGAGRCGGPAGPAVPRVGAGLALGALFGR